MEVNQLLIRAVELGASDVHITVGIPPCFRINGRLKHEDMPRLTAEDTEYFVKQLLTDEKKRDIYFKEGEIDLSYGIQSIGRFRVNLYHQRGACAASLRIVKGDILTVQELNLPEVVTNLSKNTRGLVLVTGATGSGKSTTLAAMIDYINTERNEHIITLEDPIEYLHKHKKSIINQREIGTDTLSYSAALRAALREDPDVILVGEMRDLETIAIAITAAETGHLVLSTLHTVGAAQTIDRIIDVFPPHQQDQIRIQLSVVLKGVVSQQLFERKDKVGRVVATEVMIATPAICNQIREGKTFQIPSIIQTGQKVGMHSMDMSIVNLYKRGIIDYDSAITYAQSQETIMRLIAR